MVNVKIHAYTHSHSMQTKTNKPKTNKLDMHF